MKIGFVVHFFDFRNDVRRLISEIAKKHEVVLFVNKNQIDLIKTRPIENTKIRIIDEKIISKRNKFLEILFYFFKRLPKSKNNFYLMECFRIEKIKDPLTRKKGIKNLNRIMKFPKILSYDWYINKLSYNKKTVIDDIDRMSFFTEISDDYFLARCIKEKKCINVYVYSWDHPYKHTRFSNQVTYKTWSEGTKQDISKLQKIDLDRIQVFGATQFAYIDEALKSNKKRMFDFKYVYFACAIGIDSLVHQEIEIIKKIHTIIKKHDVNLKLVVRPYPVLNDWKLYDELRNEDIVFDDDFRTKNLSINENSIQEKFEKIKNAELLLHLGTTFGLEASFFETPSVIVDFGYDKNTQDTLHVKHFIHQGQNVKYLIDTCPDQCFTSEKDLKKWLDDYELDTNKLSKNNQISSNFYLESFEVLTEKFCKN